MVFWRKKTTQGSPQSSSSSAAPRSASSAEGPAPGGSPGGSGERPPTEFLSGDANQDRRSVQVLLGAIARVSESRDLESLLDYVVDRSIEVTGAERGFLVLVDESGQQSVRVARLRGGERVPDEDIKYSTSVVQRVLDEESPMRTTVQSDAEALELGASVFDLKLRAVMCVPLKPAEEALEGKQRPLSEEAKGALYVDSKAATREFGDEDLSLFFALAQHIAIALENARLNMQSLEKAKLEKSLEIARTIQSDLMPKKPKTVPGLDTFGWYQPAEHASGDFYDFVPTADGRLMAVLGDVTGHGVGPALITATAQASLRSYARILHDPAAIVNLLNQDLTERMDDGMFVTLFLGLFGGDGRVSVLNAGQTPPLIWRQESATIECPKGDGPALGMMPDFEYAEGASLALAPGDAVLVFTDGFVEARHRSRPDRLFDESGMRAVVADVAPRAKSAAELGQALVEAVREFSGNVFDDDMTLIAVRRVDA